MNRIILLAFLFLTGLSAAGRAWPPKLHAAMDTLDAELRASDQYISTRQTRLDSLRSAVPVLWGRAASLQALGDAYKGFNNDSALSYLNKARLAARDEKLDDLALSIELDYLSLLPQFGIFTDAFASLDSLERLSMEWAHRKQFFEVRSKMLIDAAEYPPFANHRAEYRRRAVTDLDSLATFMRPGGTGERLVRAQALLLRGNETMGLGEINEVYDALPAGDPMEAVVAGMLATYYENNPERYDEYVYYLTVSATADVRAANGEMASLTRLGNAMFTHGDLERAFDYLSASGRALSKSGSRLTISEIAPPLAVYSNIMEERDRRHSQTVLWVCIAAGLLCAACIFFAVNAHRSRRKVQRRYDALAATIDARDRYITRLLDVCSVYIDTLDEFNRLILRKLKANQAQDLLKTVESGKVLQDQTDKFFTVFDQAVLNIFPNFLGDVNALLQEDKRLALAAPGRLTPELRIVAFMRLGVTDSNRLAKFLGLSLNTIYTYRNRLKTRAVDREQFESQIKLL